MPLAIAGPGHSFTHVASYEGSQVALEIALGLPMKADWAALPHCTFTDPEVAQVGLTEQQARERFGDATKVIREDFSQNDRAVCEGDDAGFVKLVMKGPPFAGRDDRGPRCGQFAVAMDADYSR